MTTGPTDVKVTTAAGGPDGRPLALKLNEGLGVMNATQVQNRRQTLLAEEQGNPIVSWWMSFCDTDKPKGQQFLGVAIVEAPGLMHAHQRTWALGINPGGQMLAFQVEGVVVEYHNKLLSSSELEGTGHV